MSYLSLATSSFDLGLFGLSKSQGLTDFFNVYSFLKIIAYCYLFVKRSSHRFFEYHL
jgi:hypothetical protein